MRQPVCTQRNVEKKKQASVALPTSKCVLYALRIIKIFPPSNNLAKWHAYPGVSAVSS